MLRLIFIPALLIYSTSCNHLDSKRLKQKITIPAPCKDSEETYETPQTNKTPLCNFANPDTSLSGIKLIDAKSATLILKVKRLNGDSTYHFYTTDKKEDLGVTVHPGDGYSRVGIFQVKYAGDLKSKATSLAIKHFATEKRIKLGLLKNEVISRLGSCYTINDSTKNTIEINYKLERPQDSRTKLLQRQNMPIYYATYKFRNDKLIEFEFGFEYP